MRIFYLSASSLPSRAANAVHVMKVAAALSQLAHEVTLFARRGNEAGTSPQQYYGIEDSFRIAYCPWPDIRGLGGFVYARGVAKTVAAGTLPDLFYGRHINSVAACIPFGRPVRLEVHAPPDNWLQHLLMLRIFAAPNFERLIAISEALRAEFLRLFPRLDPARTAVVHDGANEVDLPSRVGEQDARPFRVGYVGHLYPGKGMELIVAIAREMPDVLFHIYGGTDHDIAHWRRQCMGLQNVTLHGHLPHGQLAMAMHTFDVALAPYQRKVAGSGSRGDIGRWMSPLKLFEYMAYGKAIVASDLPVIREIIRPGQNGVLCAPEDVAGWCGTLRDLFGDPAQIIRLGQGARTELAASYTWKERARRILE